MTKRAFLSILGSISFSINFISLIFCIIDYNLGTLFTLFFSFLIVAV